MLKNDLSQPQIPNTVIDLSLHPHEEKNLSLAKLMDKVYEAEEGLLDLTQDDLKELFGNIRGKVDNTYNFLKHLEFSEMRVDADIKTLQNRKKTMQNAQKSLKSYLAHTLEVNDTPVIFGEMWQVKLQKRESIKAKSIDLTSDHYLELNDRNHPVVNRSYSWDAKALKSAYKSEPEKFGVFVEVGITMFPQFSAKKEG